MNKQLPRWKCHKEVEGFRVDAIDRHFDDGIHDGATLVEINDNKVSHGVIVSQQYMDKHQPQVGGYYVRYMDGYESFSPPVAFLSGYTPIKQGE